MRLIFLVLAFTLSFSIAYPQDFYINRDNDTINCIIQEYKRKERYKEFFEFIVTDSTNSQIVLTPSDAIFYSRKGQEYKIHKSFNDSLIFLKVLEKGRIELYEGASSKVDNSTFHLLKYPSQPVYYLYRPEYGGIVFAEKGSREFAQMNLQTVVVENADETFKTNILKFFPDCLMLRNKILSGFYGLNDLRPIVREYNNCF